MQDNYIEIYRKIYSAYLVACGGYYEPKSERDYMISISLGNLLNVMQSYMREDEVQRGKFGSH